MSELASLPAEWAEILQEVNARLEQAIDAVDARAARFADTPVEPASVVRQQELTGLAENLGGLGERSRQAQALVDDADQGLQAGEEMLRQHLARTEDARQKLADWLSRAIG